MEIPGASLQPLAGGYGGETFLAETAGERSVVHIYGPRSAWRGPEAAVVDASMLRLVRGLLPVAEVLEVHRADPSTGTPPLLVTSFLPGRRLDEVLPTASAALVERIAGELGHILGRLGQMPMLQPGLFVDGTLRTAPMPPGGSDLVEWVVTNIAGTALGEWSAADRSALLAVADSAQRLLDTVERCCLVHSDFNPKNLLVDPDTGVVTGVVDWEYAHAGSPYSDLGNLLRFDREPVFVDAVFAGYEATTAGLDRLDPHGAARERIVDLARAADLWALVELAAHRTEHVVAARAHGRLLAIARSGDLHAVD